MEKSVLFMVAMITFLSISFVGCSSFEERYKPLYQVKPIVEKKGE